MARTGIAIPPRINRLTFIGSIISCALIFGFRRQTLAAPFRKGTGFGQAYVHRPARHLFEGQKVEHGAIKPAIGLFDPASWMLFVLQLLPLPVLEAPIARIGIGADGDEFKE